MFTQVEDAKFREWSYWSNWIDVCIFSFAGYGYLLQMKVNRFNGKKFKAIVLGNGCRDVQATCIEVENGRGVK